MSNNLFAVVLTKGQEAGAERLREAYSEARLYKLENGVFIVAGETLSTTVAKAAGLTKEDADAGIRGIVFKLNGSYTGYASRETWEWLEEAEERA